ncbi:MAG: hypothetical protein AAF403_06480 [Pseudomonadota bacterium]
MTEITLTDDERKAIDQVWDEVARNGYAQVPQHITDLMGYVEEEALFADDVDGEDPHDYDDEGRFIGSDH